MTLSALQTKANTKLQEFWDALVIREEAYRIINDNYFQLLITSPVVDGVDTAFVVTHPSDEQYQADVNFSFSSPIPFQISVDVWDGETKGFTATAIVELLDGRRFKRSRKLTDTRILTQDWDNNFPSLPDGDPYLNGDTPTVETTSWEEIIEVT